MSVAFLFGAGASAFSGECRPTTPPLGKDLFAELVKLGGVAASVEPDLAACFTDFEFGMEELCRRHNTAHHFAGAGNGRVFRQFLPRR